jgi:hypothetical protein
MTCERPPVITSLKLGGKANGSSLATLEQYFQCVGQNIESLSLQYCTGEEHGSFSFPLDGEPH